ncbi:MAG TPA: site-2 protease family protein [Actinomycetota bacterium]|nr:site-2 protease family protein [Actinomycetota bacterium]
MHSTRITVLRVRGIPIDISWSWVPIVVFLVWSLQTRIFPENFPGLSSGAYLVMAVVAALALFASVVLHELGHALRALREGMQIDGITLWLFGGVARFVGMFPSPGAELRIAAAGPAVTAVLLAAFGAAGWAAVHAGLPAAVRGVLVYLAAVNLLLLAFNLVPALPLDGGRMLRALLWRHKGNFAGATTTTGILGQGFGLVLCGLGIANLTADALTTGLWLCLIGVFIVQAARSELAAGTVDRAFGAARVRDVMAPPRTVEAASSVADALAAGGARPAWFPVTTAGNLVGLLSREQAENVPAADRAARTVAQTMTPAAQVARLGADEPVRAVLGTLQAASRPAVVVDGGGSIAGIVTMDDVARALQSRLQNGRPSPWRAHRARLGGGIGAAVLLLLVVGFVYHPPIYVASPTPAVDISQDITINGVPVHPVSGRFLLVAVRADQHTLFGTIAEAFHPHRSLIPSSAVGTQAFENDLFRESRMLAAAAAATADGMQVTMTGHGAEVTGVRAGSPAASVLRTGDLITGVAGQSVGTEFDLQAVVRSHPAGTAFLLHIVRHGQAVAVQVTSSRIDGLNAIGVDLLTKDISVSGPFTISFRDRPIGGPSAGLVYALAISDALGNLDTGGRAIAATGTIDRAGAVGDVGDVDLKAIGAADQGARLFIVPASETQEAKGPVADVLGVSSLDEALNAVQAGH